MDLGFAGNATVFHFRSSHEKNRSCRSRLSSERDLAFANTILKCSGIASNLSLFVTSTCCIREDVGNDGLILQELRGRTSELREFGGIRGCSCFEMEIMGCTVL
jgi:hypothetical protein